MNLPLYKKRILVVEDEHFMRMLIIQALGSIGFTEIVEAENAHFAFDQISNLGPFDLILCDIEMKPLNGLDVIRRVRMGSTRQPHDSRVVFLTGLSDVKTLSSASTLDVQGYLLKPFTAKILQEKIQEVFATQPQVKEPSAYANPKIDTGAVIGGDDKHSADKTSSAGNIKKDTESAVRSVKPVELLPGWILRKDICAKGVLMLKAGTVLHQAQILVIKNMASVLDDRLLEVEVPAKRE